MEAGLWLLCYHGWFLTNSTPSSLAGSNLETGDGVLDGHLHTPDFTAIQALVVFGSRPPPPLPSRSNPTDWFFFLVFPAGWLIFPYVWGHPIRQNLTRKIKLGFFSGRFFSPNLFNTEKKVSETFLSLLFSRFLLIWAWIHSSDWMAAMLCREIFAEIWAWRRVLQLFVAALIRVAGTSDGKGGSWTPACGTILLQALKSGLEAWSWYQCVLPEHIHRAVYS